MEFKESNYSNLRIKPKHNCNTNLFALRNVEIWFFSLAKLVELYCQVVPETFKHFKLQSNIRSESPTCMFVDKL
jgi:hypothetical protein